MPIMKILSFLFGDDSLYFIGYCKIFALAPRLTSDGWVVWMVPVWREDSSSGGGWDTSWDWEYHRKLPDKVEKPVDKRLRLGVFDKWMLWFMLFMLFQAAHCYFKHGYIPLIG